MKKAFATLLSCLLISSQLGLGVVLASQPAAAAECGHCPCGSEASCCEGDGQADQPLPALPQRQTKFQVSPVVLDGQAAQFLCCLKWHLSSPSSRSLFS